MADGYWLWSNYQNGGETDTVRAPGGGDRNVVLKRNVTPAGTKVTKASLKVEDDEWDALIEAGVVRDYPFPEMPANSQDSPVDFLRRTISEAAQSEEERMMAAVGAAINADSVLVEESQAVNKAADKDK